MIGLLGTGRATGDDAEGAMQAFLRSKKTRKYMGKQDVMAIAAAGRALASAGLGGDVDGPRTGLFVAVGHIPFERQDIDPVLEASLDDAGAFSIARFSDRGYQRAHPLLTFRCLPNMPAFHVSLNFGIMGRSFVSYPGAGAFYTALEEATLALEDGDIDIALVGGVAHQRNFLVEHHFARLSPPVLPEGLEDAAGFLVLGARDSSVARRASLTELRIGYSPFDALDPPAPSESHVLDGRDSPLPGDALGAATLPFRLGAAFDASCGSYRHRIQTRDGVVAESLWTAA